MGGKGFVGVGVGSGIVLDSQVECCRFIEGTPVNRTRCDGKTDEKESICRESVAVTNGQSEATRSMENVHTRVDVIHRREIKVDDIFL